MSGNVKVIVLRPWKRNGKEVTPGTELEIPRAEYDKGPVGLLAEVGTLRDPEVQAQQTKQAEDDADRAEKLRRLEAERTRKEQEALRQVELIKEQQRLAEAGAAKAAQRKRTPLTQAS